MRAAILLALSGQSRQAGDGIGRVGRSPQVQIIDSSVLFLFDGEGGIWWFLVI
jgi:hypothetical protein